MRGTVLSLLLLAVSASGVLAEPTRKPGMSRAFDGRWSIEVVTERGECDRAYRYSIRIENGQARYDGDGNFTIAGRVSTSGAVKGGIVRGEDRASILGTLVGRSGSGTWTTSGATVCGGRWNAERRG